MKSDSLRKSKKIIAVLLVVIMVMFAVCGCGSSGQNEDPQQQAETDDSSSFLLKGAGDEDISITVGELKKMESVTEKAEANRSNGEKVKVKATGPLLKTVLEEHGINPDDYGTLRFNASDGYSIAVTSDIIRENDIILSYLDDGKPLSAENGPVRVVVPGQRAMYWVRMLESIDFEAGDDTVTADSIYFLEAAETQIEHENIDIAGKQEECISTDKLVSKYGNLDDNTVRNVYMTAADGLSKNETKDNFLGRYIRLSGEHAPEFTGPDIPEGMTVKDFLTANYGGTAFFSLKSALTCNGVVDIDGTKGLLFSTVIRSVGSMSTDQYVLTDLEGSSTEFVADDLSDAVVYMKDGKVIFSKDGSSAKFGSEKGAVIEGLLSISAKAE